MKILLTGVGTAGHLIPLLAIVSELKNCKKAPQPCGTMELANAKPNFLLLTPDSEFNKNCSDAGIQIKIIKAGKLRRYFSWENFTDIFKIIIGFFQSLYYIYKFKPDVVFSKGGFASIPPVIVAYILRIPILTHESDITPGLANKVISRFASKIFISFEETKKYFPNKKTIFTGNLIRKDILTGDKKRAQNYFDLKENLPTVLIFGGSQGARNLNKIILEALPNLFEKYQIIHLCGTKNYEEMKLCGKTEFNSETSELNSVFPHLANQNRYKLYPYLNKEMKDAYALADVIIARAGANSLAEIMALEKPSIIIPLPTSANDHQLQNAEFFVKKEMIIMIREEDLTSEKLVKELFTLLSNDKVKDRMVENIRKYNAFLKQDAARRIANVIDNSKC